MRKIGEKLRNDGLIWEKKTKWFKNLKKVKTHKGSKFYTVSFKKRMRVSIFLKPNKIII